MTRLLTLVRHAKSSWKGDHLLDDERPLNERGRRDKGAMALRFAAYGHSPDLLISSYATRALTTARAFANQLHYPIESIRLSEAIYDSRVDDLYNILTSMNNQYRHACWFGHNPTFTDFLNDLCDTDIDNIPTCGIAHIQLSVETWDQVKPREGTLLTFDFPKRQQG